MLLAFLTPVSCQSSEPSVSGPIRKLVKNTSLLLSASFVKLFVFMAWREYFYHEVDYTGLGF